MVLMYKMKSMITVAGIAALIGVASPVFAEAAPVFDVDTFEAGTDAQDQELPMPPAPGEEGRAQAADSSGAVTSPAPAGVGAGAAASTAQADDSQQQGFRPMEEENHAVGNVAADATDHPSSISVGAVPAAKPTSGVSVSTENLSPDQRMRRLEQQISNLQNSQSASQVNSLQGEVQSLRGQIEQLNHELAKVRAQEKTQLADAGDTDTTVSSDADVPAPPGAASAAGAGASVTAKSGVIAKKTQAKKASPHVSETDELSAAAPTTASSPSTPKDQPNVAEEQQIYQTAYDLIKAKKYNEAVTALQGMLKKYPSGQFASNAHYWLGELYGLMSKNDNALEEFTVVIAKFPGSPRVSDAQLKVGLILAAQSKWPEAKKAFKAVINTYPGTASSRLASEQLKQIKLAGH